jgi:hypothetical protein
MAVASRKSKEQIVRELEQDQSAEIERAEIVRGAKSQPIAFRASAPLLEALQRLAEVEHRSRGNLIQYILWKYIRERNVA